MSRFIDKLNRVSQVMPQPMGFRRSMPSGPEPRILFVAGVSRVDDNLAEMVAGADAGLLLNPAPNPLEMIKQVCGAAPGILWGCRFEKLTPESIKEIAAAGCDFFAFSSGKTPLLVPEDDRLGWVLEVAPSLDKDLFMAVEDLPVDAALIGSGADKEYYLTWENLMLFRHFVGLVTKPVLVSVPANVTAGELKLLWEIGVDGVVIPVGVSKPSPKLAELRQEADKLISASPRKQKRLKAVLPQVSPERAMSEEEE